MDKEATCTEDGYKSIHCTMCDEVKDIVILKATGHSWGSEYTMDKEVTCTEDGSKSIHCTICDAKKNVIDIKASHSWSTDYTIDKEVTCTEDGSKSIHCTVCDEKKNIITTHAPGHKFIEDKCEVCSCLSIEKGVTKRFTLATAWNLDELYVETSNTNIEIVDTGFLTIGTVENALKYVYYIDIKACALGEATIQPYGKIGNSFSVEFGKSNLCVVEHNHTYESTTVKATLSKNGKTVIMCPVCGYVSKTTTIYYPKTITLSSTSYTYNGKVQTPTVTVKDSKGNTLKKDTDYTITYESGRKNTGKYTITVKFKGKYSGTKTLTYTIAPKTTSKVTATQSTTSVKLTWTKVEEATGYRVFMKTSSGWETLKNTTSTTYTSSGLKSGTKYTFAVRPYKIDGNDTILAKTYTTLSVTTKPAVTSKISVSSTTSTIKLTWNKVIGATGYRVYVYKDKKWVKLTDTSKNTYTINNLKTGTKYTYAVKAYIKVDSSVIWADSYKKIATATKPATPTLKVSSTKTSVATLTWTNVSGESGYQIYYSTKKDSGFKKYSSPKADTTKASVSDLTSGQTYYFRVRAYIKTDSGIVYGGYQTVKVKIK